MTTPSIDPVGQRLITQLDELVKRIQKRSFPAALVGETTDDGETYPVLRCPHCGAILSEGETLGVVDWGTRLTDAEPVYEEDFIHRSVSFDYGNEDEDFETLHYQCNGCENAISLPEGWTE